MIELTEEVRQKFKEHAIKELPREACGLVSVVRGKQIYHPCKNISRVDTDFILDPTDYVIVEDSVIPYAGEILAVVHSHPSTSAKPTPTDLVGCESSGLPWLIYSLKTKEWCYFAPTGYRAPLIGRVFKHGVFDCYSAARDWYKEKLSLNLPDFEREDKWWEKGQNLFIDNFASAGFHPVEDGKPEYGDIILMNIGSPVVNHCAVYIGKDQIFHQTINRLSSREVYGGMWKKNTRLVLRYKR